MKSVRYRHRATGLTSTDLLLTKTVTPGKPPRGSIAPISSGMSRQGTKGYTIENYGGNTGSHGSVPCEYPLQST